MIRRLIIDGYNLLYRDPALHPGRARDLQTAREQLIRKIDRLADALAERVEIVFDGRAASHEQVKTGKVRLIYSPAHKTADTVIEQIVHTAPAPEEICVVTTDRPERETVAARDAQTMSCISFIEWLERLDKEVARHQQKPPKRRFTLGDCFPE